MTQESDFRRERREAIAKRNGKNKQRARAMEQRIAAYLDGRRVPFSGAGGVKGDVLVSSSFGMYLVECKLSEGWSKHLNCESLTTSFAILRKLEYEVSLMRARFGVLVFHYHNVRADYVIMRGDWFRLIQPESVPGDSIVVTKDTKTILLPINTVKNFLDEAPKPWFYICNAEREYAVMDIRVFRSFVAADG